MPSPANSSAQRQIEFDFDFHPDIPSECLDALAPAIPTKVFGTYWRFAVERQAVFFRRLKGDPEPWTTDPIIQAYKFTNAYRAADRVSQYLIRHIIYSGDQSREELFFRIILFKLFNKIETWELLKENFGIPSTANFSFKRYDSVLRKALDSGKKIYSGAYIMPPGKRSFGYDSKHQNHLCLIELMLKQEAARRLSDATGLGAAFEFLTSFPGIGRFLGFQYAIDVNYSTVTNFDEMEFVVAGPGAIDGISKCFTSTGGLNCEEIIRLITEQQELHLKQLGLSFRSLFGRPLQLIDCQNLFCEISKYSRVAHPDVVGKSQRTRIKQKFSPRQDPLRVWFPPKWKINSRLTMGGYHC